MASAAATAGTSPRRLALRAVLVVLGLAQLAAGECLDDSWLEANGKCWKRVSLTDTSSRDDLAQACRDLRPAGDSRAFLPAIILNVEDHLAAVRADDDHSSWIGLKGIGDKQWVWEDGTLMEYSNWSENQPSEDGFCVHLNNDDPEHRWNDLTCSSLGGSMVCQHTFTLEPTAAPSVSPTTPTAEPTRLPTMSPTVTVDACSTADRELWENVGSVGGNFDSDHSVCELVCAYTIGTRAEEVVSCVRDCYADTSTQRDKLLSTDPYSFECSHCFGLYSSCLLRECECFDRDISFLCEDCSKEKCESPFLSCSGFLSFPPVEKEEYELDDDIVLIAAIAGGSAVLCMAGVGLFALLRRNKKTADALAEMSAPAAAASAARPKLATAAAAMPTAKAAMALPAPASRSSALERRQVLFDVLHPFTAEEDDELSVAPGGVVQGLREIDSSWWLCYDPETGDEGMVPAANLRLRPH